MATAQSIVSTAPGTNLAARVRYMHRTHGILYRNGDRYLDWLCKSARLTRIERTTMPYKMRLAATAAVSTATADERFWATKARPCWPQ